MDILPQVSSITRNTKTTLAPLLKEYAWDFDNDDFLLSNGNFIIVEGLEALQVRNYLSLKTYKGRFFIYKNKVGTKLKDLIGKNKNYVSLNVREMLEEALVDNVYVTSINNITTNYEDGKLIVEFTVVNIYENYSEKIEI